MLYGSEGETSPCSPRTLYSDVRAIVEHHGVDSPAGPAGTTDLARQRALAAARAADDNRGRQIVVLDLRELTSLFDYFVLATGTSRRQLHAMGDEIDRLLQQEMGDRRLGAEGYGDSHWILLDYGDVVVHLFDEETREYYRLEDLWDQAKRVPFEPRGGAPCDGPNQAAELPDAD